MSIPEIEMKLRHELINRLHDIDIIGFRALAQLLPSLLIPSAKAEVIIHTRNGLKLLIDPRNDSGVELRLYRTGIYEKGTLHLLSTMLRKGDVFVDVGANIGLMSLHAANVIGPTGAVIAYEPRSRTADIFQYNIALNGRTNVHLRRKAVGSEPGIAQIYDHSSGNRGRASLVPTSSGTFSETIEIVRLDEDLGEQIPTMVKIDVEGYELEVLHGMSGLFDAGYFPTLILEWSNDRASSDGQGTASMRDLIQGTKEYEFFKMKRGKERASGLKQIVSDTDFPKHDNLVCIARSRVETFERSGLIEKS